MHFLSVRSVSLAHAMAMALAKHPKFIFHNTTCTIICDNLLCLYFTCFLQFLTKIHLYIQDPPVTITGLTLDQDKKQKTKKTQKLHTAHVLWPSFINL